MTPDRRTHDHAGARAAADPQQPRRAGRAHRRGGQADPDPGPQAGPPRRRRATSAATSPRSTSWRPCTARCSTSRPRRSNDPERDRFILSKGHVAGALYTTLAAFGFLPVEELATFLKPLSALNGHPNRTKVAGVEANTGPLGHGLPVAVGHRLVGQARRVVAPYVCAGRRRRAAGGQQLGGDDGGLAVPAGPADRDRRPEPAAAGRDHQGDQRPRSAAGQGDRVRVRGGRGERSRPRRAARRAVRRTVPAGQADVRDRPHAQGPPDLVHEQQRRLAPPGAGRGGVRAGADRARGRRSRYARDPA